MSDLPSRDHFADLIDDDSGAMAASEYRVLRAYALRELQTEAEWREAIDWKRIEEILDELCRDWYDMVIREGKTFDFGAAIRALDTAIGDTA